MVHMRRLELKKGNVHRDPDRQGRAWAQTVDDMGHGPIITRVEALVHSPARFNQMYARRGRNIRPAQERCDTTPGGIVCLSSYCGSIHRKPEVDWVTAMHKQMAGTPAILAGSR